MLISQKKKQPNQATKEVQQVVAGMKAALQVASSQSLPTEDLQATK